MSTVNLAITQANQTYSHSLRSGIGDALHEQIREDLKTKKGSGVNVLTSRASELVTPKPEGHEARVVKDSSKVLRASPVSPPSYWYKLVHWAKFLVEDHGESLFRLRVVEWLVEVRDQSYCWKPGE